MNITYYFFFYSKINFVVQNKENIGFQMFVIYLDGKTLKLLLLKILVTKIICFKYKRVINQFIPMQTNTILNRSLQKLGSEDLSLGQPLVVCIPLYTFSLYQNMNLYGQILLPKK